jgi:hypothetical protein
LAAEEVDRTTQTASATEMSKPIDIRTLALGPVSMALLDAEHIGGPFVVNFSAMKRKKKPPY